MQSYSAPTILAISHLTIKKLTKWYDIKWSQYWSFWKGQNLNVTQLDLVTFTFKQLKLGVLIKFILSSHYKCMGAYDDYEHDI
jgi:hypothetical protein